MKARRKDPTTTLANLLQSEVPKPGEGRALYTEREVAQMLGVGQTTVRDWRASGQLKFFRPSKQPLFSAAQIASFLESREGAEW